MSLLINNAAQVLTMTDASLGVIENGAVYTNKGKIVKVGKTADLADIDADEVIDATGKVVTPGLIDCHTHLLFAGTREQEYQQKLAGKTYLEILAAGGGILSTVKKTRAASEGQLIDHGKKWLQEFKKFGVTTVEVKTGYGLDFATEEKLLNVANKLNEESEQEIVTTFLGAHTFPEEQREQPEVYVTEIVEKMLPAFKDKAEFCDIFLESGAFDRQQSLRILQTAKNLGYKIKLHTNQITADLGGIDLAADLKAISVDHLDNLTDVEVDQLAKTGAVAVLLPGANYFLRAKTEPPVAKLRTAGIPMAISTDFNPGSCPSANLSLMMSLAVQNWGMQPEEAWQAVTVNAARALVRDENLGSLEPGKKANLTIWDMPNYLYPFYHFGHNFVERVITG